MTTPSSPLGLFTGQNTIVTGVEDDPGGGLRMYVGHRYLHKYSVVHPRDEDNLRDGWRTTSTGLLFVDVRPLPIMPHATLPCHDPGFHHRNPLPL